MRPTRDPWGRPERDPAEAARIAGTGCAVIVTACAAIVVIAFTVWLLLVLFG